jgi:hypothetical protein
MERETWEDDNTDHIEQVLIAAQQIEITEGQLSFSPTGAQMERAPDFGSYRVVRNGWRLLDLNSLLSLIWGPHVASSANGCTLTQSGLWEISSYMGVSFLTGATSMTWRILGDGSEIFRGSTKGEAVYGLRVVDIDAPVALTAECYAFGGDVNLTLYNDYYGIGARRIT